MNSKHNPAEYWNGLVGKSMCLREVGWPNWTEAVNAARYKLSQEQVSSILDRRVSTPPDAILELGCGVGFWTDFLLSRYPLSRYVGVDISEVAVKQLKRRHSSNQRVEIQHYDVSCFGPQLKRFHLIICFEVLLHIVDNANWSKTIRCISDNLASDGIALVSDPISLFSPAPEYLSTHNCRIRHISEWREALTLNNLEIIDIVPRSFLLDNNFDFSSSLARKAWQLFFLPYNALLSIQNKTLGKIIGNLAYNFDKRYVTRKTLGHSCKLLLLRKAGNGNAMSG